MRKLRWLIPLFVVLGLLASATAALAAEGYENDDGWTRIGNSAWPYDAVSDPNGPSNNVNPNCHDDFGVENCMRRAVQGTTGQQDYKFEASFAHTTTSPNGQTYQAMVQGAWKYLNKPSGPCGSDPTGVQASTPNMCMNQSTSSSFLNYRRPDLGSSLCGSATPFTSGSNPKIITFAYLDLDDTNSRFDFGLPASATCGLFQSVLLHEDLHTLGMGHTLESDSGIFQYAGPSQAFTRPQNDDKRGLQQVYGLSSGGTSVANDGTNDSRGDPPYCCPSYAKNIPVSDLVARNEGRSWAVLKINSVSATSPSEHDIRLVLNADVVKGAKRAPAIFVAAGGTAEDPIPSFDISAATDGATVLVEYVPSGRVTDLLPVSGDSVTLPERFKNNVDQGKGKVNLNALLARAK